jgi:phage terminase small subunit
MHVFKRFFLLTAIIASFLIPGIVFTSYVETVSENIENMANVPYVGVVSNEPKDLDMINWSLIMTTAYVIGVVFFGFRFFRNLFQILRRIKRNPNFKEASSVRVLLKEVLPPHTFLSYIFLNKKKYEENAIPKEVLLHEETHAKQRHSLDVLFVEFLQVILWFNPLVYLYKKAIKLNHEFLADNAVLQQEIHTKNYQNTLLSYLSKESLEKYQSTGIANAINYSSIKKRFTVMKKRTSKKAIVLRSFLLIPLSGLLLFGFSESKVIEIQKDNVEVSEIAFLIENIAIRIDEEGNLYNDDNEKITLESLEAHLLSLNKNLSKIEREQQVSAIIKVTSNTPKAIIKEVDRIVTDYGVAQIDVVRQEPLYIGILKEDKTEQSQIEKFNTLAKKYNAVPIEKRVIPLKDLKILERIYKGMTKIQKKEAQPFPECLPKNSQDGASRDQMAAYNALAKKYNEMDSNRMRILKSDVERLEFIYSLMSDKQKADAEPFPDFPEPPPAPQASNSINSPIAPKSPRVLKGRVSNVPPPPNVNHPKTITGRVSKVPAPPQPIAPLDHVIEMAKKGAAFFYEGKNISSDEAIKLMKNNKDLNIDSRNAKGKKPVVKITVAPIYH